MRHQHFLLCTAGLLGLTLAGCTTDLNARTTIGAAQTLPALAPAEAAPPENAVTARLDRGDWEPIEFRVPVDGVVHAPLWRSGVSFDDDPARQHGLYPTAETALQLGEDGGVIARGMLVEPARTLFDLFAMPVRMVFDPPWERTQSPSMFKRWHAGEWLAGPLPEE